MSSSGNEQKEAFWASEQGHPSQHQQQFVTPDGSIPTTSNNFFHQNTTTDSSAHAPNYGHPSSGDNFTVLSDGYGNFIKVYHQPTEDVNINNPAGKYEYELFSSNNNFMRPAPGFGFLFHQQPSQASGPSTTNNSTHVPQNTTTETTGSNTNMLINQLVGNWAPTLSGTYSPFGSGSPSLLSEGLPRSSEAYVQQQQQQVSQPQLSPVRQPPVQPVHNNPTPINLPQSQQTTQSAPTPVPGAVNYNQLNDDNSAKLNQNVKKQRIVAEVKPMRMSYSDVLSKNVAPSTSSNASSLNNGTAGGTSATNGTAKSHNSNSNQSGNHSLVGSRSSKGDKAQSKKMMQQQQSGSAATDEKFGKKAERPAGSGQKKSTQANNYISSGNNLVYVENGVGSKTTSFNGSEKNTKKMDKSNNKAGKGHSSEVTSGSFGGKKNRSRNFTDAYTVQDVNNSSSKENSEGVEELEEDDEEEENEGDEDYEEYDDDTQQQQSFMYNVKKNNNPNETHIEKISGTRTAYKRGGRGAVTSRVKVEKSYQPTSGKRGQRPRKNQKYVMIQKILNAWFEYTIIVVMWLWSLVSDVVYLSLRLCWDYIVAGYQYCKQHFANLKYELQQNRPGAWFRSVWKSFDNRFTKDSRWAFWRGKSKVAPAEEQTTSGKNYYKDGRLPSTADEAMSSLLNCKGKDAYSILGVSPECTQEQIRKHYKKIAVLVHPDKNKQPGAEEAFKVLQRSFELIGEPENRKSYDQSLAEALNAEKAWSEINDLLTQLHTKISEAANTIRCSSCCLRHPRKPTGRPHYAARECNSCKIRHSAREGDIWAETSFFGLRWKYLAMMEGNVYDITEWANCQKGALSHLQPNSHIVQYRIVLGGNSQQQQQQGNQQQAEKEAARSRKEAPPSEPNLDDFLNNIYGGQNQQQQQSQSGSRRRHRRN